MVATVRVVTDSNTMIPPALADALSVVVVPLTVTVGGDEYVEDASLEAAAVYRRLRAGEPATTSSPSPGTFVEAYRALGPGPIVSVHIGGRYSATADAARLASTLTDADVTVVDTGTASFLAGCCVLAAAEAACAGADRERVVAAAERTAETVASVFTLAELERGRAGGRFVLGDGEGVPVLLMERSGVTVIGRVRTADDAADMMFDHLDGLPQRLRIGVGDADAGPIVDELVARLRSRRPDAEIIRYVVGPTVAAHAGMGTFGVVYHPLDDAEA